MKMLVIVALLLSGCGNLPKAHNISKASEAIQFVRVWYEDNRPESLKPETVVIEDREVVVRQPDPVMEALDDALDRVYLEQVACPLPKDHERIPRSTREKPNREDDILYAARAGEVKAKEAARRRWHNFLEPFVDLWWAFSWAAKGSLLILLILVFWYVRKRLMQIARVIAQILPEAVPDKEKRKEIGKGNIVGKVYDKDKASL